ncbi:hypothetical protein VST7929_00829 [Vibrio stylophorae]|uniref:Sel1 repeat family protein n=1 Tax=Vibrio stylophorae TaxID=659351 RepID=A0ABN8DT46_9VIBR|nr:tetratricopeptide repeat protein [Vibrio stylophorae]CAH0532978.1 hypothetical protein VST7929_00829 [Vibrio stylophorae]
MIRTLFFGALLSAIISLSAWALQAPANSPRAKETHAPEYILNPSDAYQQAIEFFEQQAFTKALPLFRILAEQGDANAQFYYALMHQRGNGVPVDLEKAETWYLKAAKQQQLDAQYHLGLLYHDAPKPMQNYQQAMNWYYKAARQGHLMAINNIGYLYQEGLGVTKNPQTAANWYLIAAEQGLAISQNNLATLYRVQKQVDNYGKAAYWFGQAAAQGDYMAQHNLGISYLCGYGVDPNGALAYTWLSLSAQQHFAPAIAELKDLSCELKPAEIQQGKAILQACQDDLLRCPVPDISVTK